MRVLRLVAAETANSGEQIKSQREKARTPPNVYPSRRMQLLCRRQLSGGAADPSQEGAEAVKRADTRWSQVRALPAAPTIYRILGDWIVESTD